MLDTDVLSKTAPPLILSPQQSGWQLAESPLISFHFAGSPAGEGIVPVLQYCLPCYALITPEGERDHSANPVAENCTNIYRNWQRWHKRRHFFQAGSVSSLLSNAVDYECFYTYFAALWRLGQTWILSSVNLFPL